MTLAEFDRAMREAHDLRREAFQLERRGNGIEDAALRDAEIEFVAREPGFPCWRIAGVAGYFNSPRCAIEAKENQDKECAG